MGGRADVLGIQRWLLKLPRPTYFTLVTFALLSWMGAFVLALEFPTRVGPRLLWALDAMLIAAAWTAHVYLAVARPQVRQMNGAAGSASREGYKSDQQAGMSPVALAVYPLALAVPLVLLLLRWWPESVPPLACFPVLAVPAGLLAAWVVRYTGPGR